MTTCTYYGFNGQCNGVPVVWYIGTSVGMMTDLICRCSAHISLEGFRKTWTFQRITPEEVAVMQVMDS